MGIDCVRARGVGGASALGRTTKRSLPAFLLATLLVLLLAGCGGPGVTFRVEWSGSGSMSNGYYEVLDAQGRTVEAASLEGSLSPTRTRFFETGRTYSVKAGGTLSTTTGELNVAIYRAGALCISGGTATQNASVNIECNP
jgi:hypothetical protein